MAIPQPVFIAALYIKGITSGWQLGVIRAALIVRTLPAPVDPLQAVAKLDVIRIIVLK